jgi:hypothetical protein
LLQIDLKRVSKESIAVTQNAVLTPVVSLKTDSKDDVVTVARWEQKEICSDPKKLAEFTQALKFSQLKATAIPPTKPSEAVR